MTIAAEDLSYIHQDGRVKADTAMSMDGQNRFRHKNSLATAIKTSSDDQTGNAINVFVTVTFDDEGRDTDDLHSTVSATSRLTAKLTGKYCFTANVRIDHSNVVNPVAAAIRVIANGETSAVLAQVIADASGSSDINALCLSGLLELEADEYIEVQAIATSNDSGTFDVAVGTVGDINFSMFYVGE
jgi:hypothetical protein